MQPAQLLHKNFLENKFCSHKARLDSLMLCTKAAIKSKKATLTLIGRHIDSGIKIRSGIRKVDRLLANKNLHSEIPSFYSHMATMLVPKLSRPLIHIDWSCVSPLNGLYLLRASLSVTGRAITIYEEVHPKRNENNHDTHKLFLANLATVLPKTSSPIIVTDAGFRAIWFNEVIKLGWDFVGRLRNKNLVLLEHEANWQLSKTFYKKALTAPALLGHGLLTKKTKVECNLILFKEQSKNRKKRNIDKSDCKASKSLRYSQGNSEPWLIVTSLKKAHNLPKKIVTIYRQRMQIEENFRDTKDRRYGFGLNESGTKTTERMAVLLLIIAIASLICWLAGLFVRQAGSAADYQAQSSKFKSALSVVYLGCEALRRPLQMTKKDFLLAIELIVQYSNDYAHDCA